MDNIKDKIKNANLKKIIKVLTLVFGVVLIFFISFYDATFDFTKLNWFTWLANTSILVGIMIFGLLMGGSVGEDFQKEKVGGLFQTNCEKYNEISLIVDNIKIYFSQFWLWFKERKLIEKKIDYLVENQFDLRVAKIIVKNIEKEDLVIGKLGYDESTPTQKIYIKNDIKIKKLKCDELNIVSRIFSLTLDTFNDSYYLSLFDDGDTKINEAELGKRIAKKIANDKRNSAILKIASSLVVSIVWGALTINEMYAEGDNAVQRAWLNLFSRICALITSFVSGYSTSVINVRDQARAIENKTNILKYFKQTYDEKIFVPETYEQMIEREYNEQLLVEQNNEKCDNNNAQLQVE